MVHRALALVLAGGLAIAACGSDDSTSGTTSPQSGGGSATAGIEAGQARVDYFRQTASDLPFNEPVSAVPAGKKLFYVQCSVPACAEIAIGVEAAAKAIGWDYQTVSHQDTPDTVASAFDTAIAAKPDDTDSSSCRCARPPPVRRPPG